jgi:hypothetical protein
MLLDPDMSEEGYIEDCQVCCNPIEIYFKIENEKVILFEAKKLQ